MMKNDFNLEDLEKPIKVGVFECEIDYENIKIVIRNENGYLIEEMQFKIKELKNLEELITKIKNIMKLKFGGKFFKKYME